MSSAVNNVTFGRAMAWACRWIEGADPRRYVISILVLGFSLPPCAAVVDDFGSLVEVQS